MAGSESTATGQGDRRQQEAGNIHRHLELANTGAFRGGVRLRGLNVRIPAASGGEALVVIKGVSEVGEVLVAFISGDYVVTALQKALRKWEEGDLNWKVDEWG